MEFLGIRTKSGAIVQPNSGEEMIRKFDFAYSTPGLATGVTVYTPSVGDILLDAWIEIDTPFNGTTPMADIGQFTGGNQGWFAYDGSGALDLTNADSYSMDTAGVLSGTGNVDWPAAGPAPSAPIKNVSLAGNLNLFPAINAGAFNHLRFIRSLPAKFTNSNPVKLVVSETGAKSGTPTGATAGAGTVYFLTGTPQ